MALKDREVELSTVAAEGRVGEIGTALKGRNVECRAAIEGRPLELGAAAEGRVAELGTALKGREVEPGLALEGHPAEPGIAAEDRPVEPGDLDWLFVLPTPGSVQYPFKESARDGYPACVDLAGFADPIPRGGNFLLAGVRQAPRGRGEADANASGPFTRRPPLDFGLLSHSPSESAHMRICKCPGLSASHLYGPTAPALPSPYTGALSDLTVSYSVPGYT